MNLQIANQKEIAGGWGICIFNILYFGNYGCVSVSR